MFCHIQIETDDGTGAITSFSVVNAIHDPGWTPFFEMRNWPLSGLRFDRDILVNRHDFPGEASPLPVVRTEARHPNSAISSVPPDEIVLVDGLIKFRAGSH